MDLVQRRSMFPGVVKRVMGVTAVALEWRKRRRKRGLHPLARRRVKALSHQPRRYTHIF